MIEIIIHMMHFCASCVSDANALPTAASALGGTAAVVGGLGDMSGSGGTSGAASGAGQGAGSADGNTPPVHANSPGTKPAAQSGNSGGPGPAAPSGDANLPVKTTALDGTETVTVTNPDGTKDVMITDPFGNQTYKAVAKDGYTTTIAGRQNDSVTTSSGYLGAPAVSTTQGPGSVTTSVPIPGGGSSFVRSNGNGTVTNGVQLDDGTSIGTTVGTDGVPRTDVTPPMPP